MIHIAIPLLIAIATGLLYARLLTSANSAHSRARAVAFSLVRMGAILSLFAFFSYLPLHHFIFMALLFMLTMWFTVWHISKGTNNNGWL